MCYQNECINFDKFYSLHTKRTKIKISQREKRNAFLLKFNHINRKMCLAFYILSCFLRSMLLFALNAGCYEIPKCDFKISSTERNRKKCLLKNCQYANTWHYSSSCSVGTCFFSILFFYSFGN